MKHTCTLLLLLTFTTAHAGLFDQAVNSLQESANTASEEAQNQVQEATAGTIKESVATAQSKVDSATAIQSMVAKAVDTSKQLESTLGDNPELKSLLTNSMTSLAQGQDISALQDLSALSAANLTDEQTTLLKGLRSDVEVLALKRNLDESGPVTAATKAIQSGDYTAASTQLNQVLQQGQLNDAQKQLVKTVLQGFGTSAE